MSEHDPAHQPAPSPEPQPPAPTAEPATSFAPPTEQAPQFAAAETPAPALPAPVATGAFCRACGTGIDARAVICAQCGVATGHGQQPAAGVVSGWKSGGIAVLLSLLITGAGHWYTGEVGRGFAFFGGAFLAALSLAFLIGVVALPAVWIWAAIDANKSAERFNARVGAAAQQPLALAR